MTPKKNVNTLPQQTRARNVRRDTDLLKSIKVTLLDIDTAIITHFREVIQPSVSENEEKIDVPIMFSDAERWKNMKKDGVFRDVKGQVQNPIIVMKRNSISRNDAMSTFNRYVNYTYQAKYTPKNKYDKFSIMSGARPTKEIYSVTMPDYVNISYECSIQTSFVESMNSLIEQIQFAADEYWGERYGYKFQVFIDDFSTATDVQSGEQRIVRSEFQMMVKAYLLPEKFADQIQTKKSFTPKRVIVVSETELSLAPTVKTFDGVKSTQKAGSSPGSSNMAVDDSISINIFLDAVEYLSETTTIVGTFVSSSGGVSTVDFTGYKLNPIPTNIAPYVTNFDRYQVYINGILIDKNDYTLTDAPDHNGSDIRVEFDESAVGYPVVSDYEVVLVGKVVTS